MPFANAVISAILSLKRMAPPSQLRYSRTETSTGG